MSVCGHVAVGDPLGQAFGDGRLAHAGLADEDRVVLGPPGQDLDDPADLLLAADDRVQLALAGQGGQIAGVLLQGLELVFGLGVGDALRSADRGQRLENGLLLDARFDQQTGGFRILVLEQGQEEMFGGDIIVLEGLGFLLGLIHDRPQRRRKDGLAALRLGPAGQRFFKIAAQTVPVDADLGQHRADDIFFLGQKAP